MVGTRWWHALRLFAWDRTTAHGTATIKVVLTDNGGKANGGNDTSAEATFTITVNNVSPTVTMIAAVDSREP